MPNPDGVLDAIDACLNDWSVSREAMRWSPDAPGPTGEDATAPRGWALWGEYTDGTRLYRTTSPPWRSARVGPGAELVIVDDAWPTPETVEAAQRRMDETADSTGVPSPPLVASGLVSWFWAPTLDDPSVWRPLDGVAADSFTFASLPEETTREARWWSAPREVSITLEADTSAWDNLAAIFGEICVKIATRAFQARRARLRRIKSEYHRRQKNRRRKARR